MAEHTIETRILLRYDTLSNWMNSTVILKKGEVAIAAVPKGRVIENLSNSTPDNTPPAIGLKVGDGFHYFNELPWVQAIAADVYNWAKASYKPSYSANEIQGLQVFVENLIANSGYINPGTGDITIAPRIYQIMQGTGENSSKYYLRYKENNEDSDWMVDTDHYIDLQNINTIIDWIGRTNLEDYPNLITRNAEQIRFFLNTLNSTDTAQTNKFVTSVSETSGIISVERAQPNFSNLTGRASVEQGGTGRATLTDNSVLVGNETGPVKLIPIAESIAANNYLVPNYLIKNYVDNATAGLTGAMHFIGEATVVINNNSGVNPRISGYDFSKVQPGDVIIYDAKEFVWSGGSWRLLGDEGSYAVKGSITNADIADDAGIDQSKIANLNYNLSLKVDKENGKQLSSNDYTTEEKIKLFNIEENAQRNIIEHIFINGTEAIPTTIDGYQNSLSIRVSALTEEEEAKITGIEAGAQVNKIEHIFLNNNELNIGIIQNKSKSVNILLTEFTEQEKQKLSEIEAGAQVNIIEKIFFNENQFLPNNNKEVHVVIDEAALNLQVIKGARVPNGGLYEDVDITAEKKLELSRIAKTGNIVDIIQTPQTYVILDCGSSTEVL